MEAMIEGVATGAASTEVAETIDRPRDAAETMDGVVTIGGRSATMGGQTTVTTTSLTTSATAKMCSD